MVDVVSVEWLADHVDDDGVVVVDVRDGWEYEGIGHVPGAVSVPFDAFRTADGEAGMLPSEDRWADLLDEAGVSADDRLVAYDDEHGVFAARFLVTAELFGHRDLSLLDGDFSAWTRAHETETGASDRTPTEYVVSRPEETPLVGYEDVLDALDSDAVVVDTREGWEFEEGHLPGAINLDWRDLVDEETRGLKSHDQLEATLADRGVTPDRRVVLYCNTARRISHTYVVLRHLGYEDVAFYEGSLTEWESHGGPIETA